MWSFTITFFATPLIHAENSELGHDLKTMEAVALLFHGKYGEQPYKLSTTADGGLALEETGQRSFRFVLHQVGKKPCVFRTVAEDRSGLNVEQFDFNKFEGGNRFVEACGPKGSVFETNCTYSLLFKSQLGYCQNIFGNKQIDPESVPFPTGSCRQLAYGGRKKEAYGKYVEAFDYIFKQCAVLQKAPVEPGR
jgi:hypothetical protein